MDLKPIAFFIRLLRCKHRNNGRNFLKPCRHKSRLLLYLVPNILFSQNHYGETCTKLENPFYFILRIFKKVKERSRKNTKTTSIHRPRPSQHFCGKSKHNPQITMSHKSQATSKTIRFKIKGLAKDGVPLPEHVQGKYFSLLTLLSPPTLSHVYSRSCNLVKSTQLPLKLPPSWETAAPLCWH